MADGRNRLVREAARILEAFFVYHVGTGASIASGDEGGVGAEGKS